MWFMGAFAGDLETKINIDLKKEKCWLGAYHCLLQKNTWFRFCQGSGAKMCVGNQMSFWGVLEGWATNDLRVILNKSQKKALEVRVAFQS